MPAALEAGRIDAASLTEPFITIAKPRSRVLAYFFDTIGKHFLIAVWFTTPQWASANRDAATKFSAVMHDAAVWANKNPDQSGAILAKYTRTPAAVIPTMTRARYGDELTPPLLQPLIDLSAKYGKYASFPAQQLLD